MFCHPNCQQESSACIVHPAWPSPRNSWRRQIPRCHPQQPTHLANHINAVTSKTNKVLGFLQQNLYDCSTRVKAASYTTMVRPILEYSAAVWDHHLQKEKTPLEMIQCWAARFTTNNYYERTPGCVNSMLQDLQWESLEERRQRNRLNLLHKINNNIVSININNFVRRNDSRTRGSQCFFQEHTTNQVFFNSFWPRTVCDWNRLSIRVSSTQDQEWEVKIKYVLIYFMRKKTLQDQKKLDGWKRIS